MHILKVAELHTLIFLERLVLKWFWVVLRLLLQVFHMHGSIYWASQRGHGMHLWWSDWYQVLLGWAGSRGNSCGIWVTTGQLCITATSLPRYEWNYRKVGLSHCLANSLKSGLQDTPVPFHNWYEFTTNFCRPSWHNIHTLMELQYGTLQIDVDMLMIRMDWINRLGTAGILKNG